MKIIYGIIRCSPKCCENEQQNKSESGAEILCIKGNRNIKKLKNVTIRNYRFIQGVQKSQSYWKKGGVTEEGDI